MEICTRSYRPRKPEASPLFRLVSQHVDEFLRVYDERFAKEHGPLRPVVERVLRGFIRCGIPRHGFARVLCDTARCRHPPERETAARPVPDPTLRPPGSYSLPGQYAGGSRWPDCVRNPDIRGFRVGVRQLPGYPSPLSIEREPNAPHHARPVWVREGFASIARYLAAVGEGDRGKAPLAEPRPAVAVAPPSPPADHRRWLRPARQLPPTTGMGCHTPDEPLPREAPRPTPRPPRNLARVRPKAPRLETPRLLRTRGRADRPRGQPPQARQDPSPASALVTATGHTPLRSVPRAAVGSVARCASASAQISGSGATLPSIEKTPSVTISRKRQDCASWSFASRSAMSALA